MNEYQLNPQDNDKKSNSNLNIREWQRRERFNKFMKIYRPIGWIFIIISFLYMLYDFITTGYLPPFGLVPQIFLTIPTAVIIVLLIKRSKINPK